MIYISEVYVPEITERGNIRYKLRAKNEEEAKEQIKEILKGYKDYTIVFLRQPTKIETHGEWNVKISTVKG